MKQSTQKILVLIMVVSLAATLVVGMLIYGIYWLFFDIQRIRGQELLAVSHSPDQAYTVTAYLNNGGATTGYAVLCSVTDNQTGKTRNFYWNYHCSQARILWLDETHVCINSVDLDVRRDIYDWRR